MSTTVVRKSPQEERQELINSLVPELREFVDYYNFGDEALAFIAKFPEGSPFFLKNGKIARFGEGGYLPDLLIVLKNRGYSYVAKDQHQFLSLFRLILNLPKEEKDGKKILIYHNPTMKRALWLDHRTQDVRLLLEGVDITTKESTSYVEM